MSLRIPQTPLPSFSLVLSQLDNPQRVVPSFDGMKTVDYRTSVPNDSDYWDYDSSQYSDDEDANSFYVNYDASSSRTSSQMSDFKPAPSGKTGVATLRLSKSWASLLHRLKRRTRSSSTTSTQN
ncbi:hypothetical protein BKA70DRAFT_44944 [Coprinopsis sp. MPI-PUGE-AT-0042]|nr:hypothetical protein BKA70DRAFT_44944 [Coprinopsis sp. MPI-PUGE-AT-0042]